VEYPDHLGLEEEPIADFGCTESKNNLEIIEELVCSK